MALNLIKVPTAKGNVLVNVRQIAFVEQTETLDKCKIVFAGGPVEMIEATCSAQTVADLANRRPPDGF